MSADGTIRFLKAGRVETVTDFDPTMTVLGFLRGRGLTGTKEGCAEGDCGACTVVLGEPEGDSIRYRAVNACILFLPTLDGKQLITVEDLKASDGSLHPVQKAMVDAHGSQCGFCTPGFVMSLFALFHEEKAEIHREMACRALAGNLCRCTGYRPILEAAGRMTEGGRIDQFSLAEPETAVRLRDLRRERSLFLNGYHAPATMEELGGLLADHPDACLLAGGTDVGLWVTKQHRELDRIIYLGGVKELARVEEVGGALHIGAGATYADILPCVEARFPTFGDLLVRLGSAQIRNSGTMGGNVANGSPIGDSMPALIALGARIVLNRRGERREPALEDFYLDYRKTALEAGEFVEKLIVPLLPDGRRFATWKVSKRIDQDISAVAVGFLLELDDEGRVAAFRAAYGGMAATPRRATAVEETLIGRPWTLETVTESMAALDRDFQPLSDMRASDRYRSMVARNLLMRFYLETAEGPARLNEVTHG
ncbi:xanthine dehydrogenase small subunit [Inquilinus sp. CAU 1745]|uniref:xanthine dehydrogenase small subunit n=1 Tax=Inquilinus sp. CAU 1745 TaxID=3140369 RepID=UPI00325BBEE0